MQRGSYGGGKSTPRIAHAIALDTGRQPGFGSGDSLLIEFDQQVNGFPLTSSKPLQLSIRNLRWFQHTHLGRFDAPIPRIGSVFHS